jgi:hypothetical protein
VLLGIGRESRHWARAATGWSHGDEGGHQRSTHGLEDNANGELELGITRSDFAVIW